jgi:hypothetical protein
VEFTEKMTQVVSREASNAFFCRKVCSYVMKAKGCGGNASVDACG